MFSSSQNSYLEYVLRCPSCNELINAKAPLYESLLKRGKTAEEAMNSLGIMNPCSRTVMANPTIVFFDAQVPEYTRGLTSNPDGDKGINVNDVSSIVFEACQGGKVSDHQTPVKKDIVSMKAFRVRSRPKSKASTLESTPSILVRKAAIINFEDEESEEIELEFDPASGYQEFQVPEYVNVPTINTQEPEQLMNSVELGYAISAKVLKGRTYLAR